MSILDTLGKLVLGPGQIVDGAAREVSNGGIFNHATISFYECPYKAMGILRDNGIKAFSPMDGYDVSLVEVHKKDKEKALKVLRRNGYECW